MAQRAHAEGVTVGFWAYFAVGAPLTVRTIFVGLWWP
jgi:Na+/H+ antiporter NhaD/arsenite permease-like protein